MRSLGKPASLLLPSRRRFNPSFPSHRHVKSLVAERHLPNAPEKHDMLQSFLSHGLQGEDLCQEVGIQLSVSAPAPP